MKFFYVTHPNAYKTKRGLCYKLKMYKKMATNRKITKKVTIWKPYELLNDEVKIKCFVVLFMLCQTQETACFHLLEK